MGRPALEPPIYLSTSLGPCSLPREAPKSQVGNLLTCLSLSPRRASASSLSSESSESSDAGEAQGCQGTLGGCLSLPISLPTRPMSFPTTRRPEKPPLPSSGWAHHIQAEAVVGRGPLPEMRSHLFKTKAPEPQPHLGGVRRESWLFYNTLLPPATAFSF